MGVSDSQARSINKVKKAKAENAVRTEPKWASTVKPKEFHDSLKNFTGFGRRLRGATQREVEGETVLTISRPQKAITGKVSMSSGKE